MPYLTRWAGLPTPTPTSQTPTKYTYVGHRNIDIENETAEIDETAMLDDEYAESESYGGGDRWRADSDGDPCFPFRMSRMSFNGRSDPPMPPDGRTLPPPTDDWFTETVELAPVQATTAGVPRPTTQSTYPGYETQQARQAPFGYAFPTSQYPTKVGQAYQGYPEPAPVAWPYSDLANTGYRAPVLPPRDVQYTQRPVANSDPYRYFAPRVEPAYPASPSVAPSKDAINIAFSRWYADQIIDLLVKPGQFRPGVRGSSEEVWGSKGRIMDEFERTGRPSLHYPKQWGRMGIPDTPQVSHRKASARFPEYEPRDPWNVLWCNQPETSSTLVAFVHEMMTRMTIAPVSVVAAVWYLTGLGLHRGDGDKGSGLREMFAEQRWTDLESVEKRVATLGFILAGKWLDDNSFLSKSWTEVTGLPVEQIDRMERYALADFHFSLYIPTSAWADHVNNLYSSLLYKDIRDEAEDVVLNSLDQMVTDARDLELADVTGRVTPAYDRRLSEQFPAAGEQATSRDWGTFARTYAINEMVPGNANEALELDGIEESVLALVGEEMEEDLEEDEFLDYDGAVPFLPTASELRRSASNSSAQSIEDVVQWRTGVTQATAKPAYRRPSDEGCAQCAARGQPCSSAYPTSNTTSSAASHPAFTPFAPSPAFKETGVYLEPGIAIMRPPTTAGPRKPFTPVYGYTNITGSRDNYNDSFGYISPAIPLNQY